MRAGAERCSGLLLGQPCRSLLLTPVPLLSHRSHRYPTPFASAGSTAPFWYSVDAGPAHIIFVRG